MGMEIKTAIEQSKEESATDSSSSESSSSQNDNTTYTGVSDLEETDILETPLENDNSGIYRPFFNDVLTPKVKELIEHHINKLDPITDESKQTTRELKEISTLKTKILNQLSKKKPNLFKVVRLFDQLRERRNGTIKIYGNKVTENYGGQKVKRPIVLNFVVNPMQYGLSTIPDIINQLIYHTIVVLQVIQQTFEDNLNKKLDKTEDITTHQCITASYDLKKEMNKIKEIFYENLYELSDRLLQRKPKDFIIENMVKNYNTLLITNYKTLLRSSKSDKECLEHICSLRNYIGRPDPTPVEVYISYLSDNVVHAANQGFEAMDENADEVRRPLKVEKEAIFVSTIAPVTHHLEEQASDLLRTLSESDRNECIEKSKRLSDIWEALENDDKETEPYWFRAMPPLEKALFKENIAKRLALGEAIKNTQERYGNLLKNPSHTSYSVYSVNSQNNLQLEDQIEVAACASMIPQMLFKNPKGISSTEKKERKDERNNLTEQNFRQELENRGRVLPIIFNSHADPSGIDRKITRYTHKTADKHGKDGCLIVPFNLYKAFEKVPGLNQGIKGLQPLYKISANVAKFMSCMYGKATSFERLKITDNMKHKSFNKSWLDDKKGCIQMCWGVEESELINTVSPLIHEILQLMNALRGDCKLKNKYELKLFIQGKKSLSSLSPSFEAENPNLSIATFLISLLSKIQDLSKAAAEFDFAGLNDDEKEFKNHITTLVNNVPQYAYFACQSSKDRCGMAKVRTAAEFLFKHLTGYNLPASHENYKKLHNDLDLLARIINYTILIGDNQNAADDPDRGTKGCPGLKSDSKHALPEVLMAQVIKIGKNCKIDDVTKLLMPASARMNKVENVLRDEKPWRRINRYWNRHYSNNSKKKAYPQKEPGMFGLVNSGQRPSDSYTLVEKMNKIRCFAGACSVINKMVYAENEKASTLESLQESFSTHPRKKDQRTSLGQVVDIWSKSTGSGKATLESIYAQYQNGGDQQIFLEGYEVKLPSRWSTKKMIPLVDYIFHKLCDLVAKNSFLQEVDALGNQYHFGKLPGFAAFIVTLSADIFTPNLKATLDDSLDEYQYLTREKRRKKLQYSSESDDSDGEKSISLDMDDFSDHSSEKSSESNGSPSSTGNTRKSKHLPATLKNRCKYSDGGSQPSQLFSKKYANLYPKDETRPQQSPINGHKKGPPT